MKRLSIILILLSLSFGTVYAQGSAFGDLKNTEKVEKNSVSVKNIHREKGKALDSYQGAKKTFTNLSENARNLTGEKAEEAKGKALEKQKEMLVHKLDSVSNYLEKLIVKVESVEKITEEQKATLKTLLSTFDAEIASYETRIDAAETTEELRTIHSEINTDLRTKLRSIRGVLSLLNISRANGLLTKLDEKIVLLKSHIDAAAEAGVDVTDAMEKYDSVIEMLVAAKAMYGDAMNMVDSLIEAGSVEGIEDIRASIIEANKKVKEAHALLMQIVGSLRISYGETPWEVGELKE